MTSLIAEHQNMVKDNKMAKEIEKSKINAFNKCIQRGMIF